MSTFTQQVGQWASGTNNEVDRFVRAVEIALFTSVIKGTPVDTGRARGNWQTSTGSPILESIDRLDPDGSAAIDEVLSGVGGAGVVTYLSNNLPYITVLEYGGYPDPPKHGTRLKGGGYEIRSAGGYSRQAPAGMVRTNLARIDEIVRAARGT